MADFSHRFSTSFEAIGTHWHISVSVSRESDWTLLESQINARLSVFEQTYSRFISDSWVRSIARSAGRYPVPDDFPLLYHFYKKLYDATGGKVTPLVGTLLSSAGYDDHYSFRSTRLASVPNWESVMTLDGSSLITHAPVLLDFGAAGKGYLIDIISDIIQSHGVTEYLVDAGGDIRHYSSKNASVEIGLEHPEDFSKAIGTISLRNQAIAGSAGNRRKWGEFHHIMDPHERRSVSVVRAVWVISESARIADGISTSLFFVTPEKLTSLASFSWVIVHDDLSVSFDPKLPGELF